ncbi:hypothetical protein B0T13DRAFT_488811 [Neurospora crassa]|nr:hypothetical protein B0T13DRAFT_492347 [Neurospora crassa]KAK3496082.1 hypothetical protein B0T13DRAFT_488811 [Neurospora crassa]
MIIVKHSLVLTGSKIIPPASSSQYLTQRVGETVTLLRHTSHLYIVLHQVQFQGWGRKRGAARGKNNSVCNATSAGKDGWPMRSEDEAGGSPNGLEKVSDWLRLLLREKREAYCYCSVFYLED